MTFQSRRADPLSRPRAAGVVCALLLALFVLVWRANTHQPIELWLLPRYAGYWAAAGVWSLSCLAFGHAVTRRVLGHTLPVFEQLAIGLGVGVFSFQLLLFALGLLQLYGPVTFFGLPAVMLLIGAPSLVLDLRRVLGRARRAHLRAAWSLSPWAVAAIAFGVVCLVALYVPIMAPANSSYDSRWRHMMLAEQYAVHGGIRRFPEGWLFGASPQFSPLLYAWAYLLPFGRLFDRVELCAHLEFVVFLWTTVLGIPAMVRALAPRAKPAVTWTARFLFSGVFLYDSNLSVGADHLGAVFAPALLLLSLRAFRGMNPRIGLLLGAMIAAAACAKETTALLLVPGPVLCVVTRFVLDGVGALRARTAKRSQLLGSVTAGVATVALSAPHWLKNLVWHGDPLYPNLYRYFTDRPWSPEGARAYEQAFRALLWSATPDRQGLLDALTTLVTFPFVPQAWWSMHRDIPVFGALFTVLLVALMWLRRSTRMWAVVGWVHVAIITWFWIHHEDRHLQALVPWMAAVVAAGATRLWRSKQPAVQGALVLLVGFQLAWNCDVYFYPSHLMVLNAPPIQGTMTLLEKSYRGANEERFSFQDKQVAVGKATPRGAVLLVHERRDSLGMQRSVVTDFYGEQYGIDYLQLGSPERVFVRLKQLGVTHLAWADRVSRGYAPLGGDVLFFEFAHRVARARRRVLGYWVAALPKTVPKPAGERAVIVLGCGSDYRSGLYRVSDLGVSRFPLPGPLRFPAPREPLGPESEWSTRAFALAVERGCPSHLGPVVRQRFEHVATRNTERGSAHEIWLRR